MNIIQASILFTSVIGIITVLISLSQQEKPRRQEVVVKANRRRNSRR